MSSVHLTRRIFPQAFGAALIVAVAAFLPFRVHAAQAVWNANIPNILCTSLTGNTCTGSGKSQPGWVMSGIAAQVSYHTDVTNLKTGALIPSGSTVPAGTTVLFRFAAHDYSDIYWVGTGKGNDSPYGDWIAGAGKPSGGVCLDKNYFGQVGKNHDRKGYAALSVAPPRETISGLPSGCSLSSDGASMSCTLTDAGVVNAVFHFAATYGEFWPAHGEKAVNGVCTGDARNYPYPLLDNANPGGGAFRLSVSAQQIPFSLTVTDDGAPPGSPSVSGGGVAGGGTAVGGAGACTTSIPYSVTVKAVDPNADTIRYGIDWDGNGIVDQFVPASGYVPSGTAQTVSRTFSTDGAKNIKVFAQNSHGFTSAWTSYSVVCASAQTKNATSTAIVSGNDGNDSGAGASISPALNLRAIPSLVSPGKTSNINWSATNVVSCTVSGDNGDSWTGTVSPVGGQTSAPILKKTVYTLSCKTKAGAALTAKAIVNILPTWMEQ